MSNSDETFRIVLLSGTLLIFPQAAYHRLKSQSTREALDRRQEGLFILLTLRPIGLAGLLGLIAFLVKPSSMAWSSFHLPDWVRWAGAGTGIAGGLLSLWAFRALGPNLTDTVVTRKTHTLVTRGPYRWVRHPFYGAAALWMLGNSLAAANWFLLTTSGLAFLLLVVRTGKEEENLLRRFGDDYRAYVQRTGRFWPRC